jgi:hypothetical protein
MDDDDDDSGGGGGDKCKRNRRNSGKKNPTKKFLRTSKETVERRNSMVNELHKTRKWSKLKNGRCSTKRQQINKQLYKTIV